MHSCNYTHLEVCEELWEMVLWAILYLMQVDVWLQQRRTELVSMGNLWRRLVNNEVCYCAAFATRFSFLQRGMFTKALSDHRWFPSQKESCKPGANQSHPPVPPQPAAYLEKNKTKPEAGTGAFGPGLQIGMLTLACVLALLCLLQRRYNLFCWCFSHRSAFREYLLFKAMGCWVDSTV